MQKYFLVIFWSFSCINFSQTWSLEKCIYFADSTNLELKEMILNKNNQILKIKSQKNKQLPILNFRNNHGIMSEYHQEQNNNLIHSDENQNNTEKGHISSSFYNQLNLGYCYKMYDIFFHAEFRLKIYALINP